MRRIFIQSCLAGVLCLSASTVQCQSSGVPTTVTIEYINSTPVRLVVDFLVSNDPNITEAELLASGGSLFTDTVDPTLSGDVPFSFDLNCDDAQAIIIDQAAMQDGPAKGSVILYQDLDFFCGEIVSFEFTTNASLSDIFINVDYFDQ